jgi:hypothetical protein
MDNGRQSGGGDSPKPERINWGSGPGSLKQMVVCRLSFIYAGDVFSGISLTCLFQIDYNIRRRRGELPAVEHTTIASSGMYSYDLFNYGSGIRESSGP